MNKLRISAEAGFSVLVISLLAACGGGGGSDSNNNGSVTLPATTGLLQSITISPAASSAAACQPVQYTALATYSDGTSNVNVTNAVFWEIDPAQSDVAIANAVSGVVAGLKAGSAVVHAWTGMGIAASAVFNVTGGTLNSIAVTPASATIAASGTQAYSAIATCSNGTLDISAMNIWSSSSAPVAAITVSGVAVASSVGATTITATAGAASASAVLNVQ